MAQVRRSRPITLSIRISETEMADLRRVALQLDRTVSYVAGLAIRQYLYGDEEPELTEKKRP